MTCTFCNDPDYGGGCINPPMCLRHYEAALIRSRLQRRGLQPNVAHAAHLMARSRAPWAVKPRNLPALWAEMEGTAG